LKVTYPVLLLLVAAIVAITAIAAVYILRRSLSSDSAPWPFYAKKPLTQPEQVLYHRLVDALPDHIVLAQVQLSRILGVKRGSNFHQWNNRINRLSVDFLVCGKDGTVLLAIELDDKSHERAARVEADARKSKALAAAEVRLVRWRVNALPDKAAIAQSIVPPKGAEPGLPG
jgi:hypothetical protein